MVRFLLLSSHSCRSVLVLLTTVKVELLLPFRVKKMRFCRHANYFPRAHNSARGRVGFVFGKRVSYRTCDETSTRLLLLLRGSLHPSIFAVSMAITINFGAGMDRESNRDVARPHISIFSPDFFHL